MLFRSMRVFKIVGLANRDKLVVIIKVIRAPEEKLYTSPEQQERWIWVWAGPPHQSRHHGTKMPEMRVWMLYYKTAA